MVIHRKLFLFLLLRDFFEPLLMAHFFFWPPRLREALSLQIDGMPRFFSSGFRSAGSLGDWRMRLSLVGCFVFRFEGGFERL